MKKRPSDRSLVVVDGVRTPFAKLGTSLAGCGAADLGRIAVSALLARTGFPAEMIDETIFGCVSQPADAANIARVIALRAGVPEEIPAMTVQRNCASGLEALTTAADRIAAGRGEVFLVGGTESMSQIPLLYAQRTAGKFARLARSRGPSSKLQAMAAFRPADFAPVIALRLGLTDPVAGLDMGATAELLSRELDISREAQDRFALESHQKAAAAQAFLQEEMVPVYCPDRKTDFVFADNGVRPDQSLDALRKLPPVFDRKTGTVTAGNSSQLTDGAVALLVMTESKARDLGLTPLGRLVDFAYAGCDPRRMGLGPTFALRDLLRQTGIGPDQVDLIEINEAFAAQVLAVLQTLDQTGIRIDRTKLNPNGGAIALGHPVGASGARLALTALRQLRRTGGRRAVVSLCVGGGQGAAALFEPVETAG